MKNLNRFILLSAGILLTLAGCQKGTETQGEGSYVRFGASSGAILTRTSYGDDINGYQRIRWSENDRILIWSDNAINRAGQSGKSAVYSLVNIQNPENSKESTAGVNRFGEDGLIYLDNETTTYTFWGMYPSKAVSTPPTDENVFFSIPSEQDCSGVTTDANGNIIEDPDMDSAVMFARSAVVSKNDLVDLKFYPAFTAFEFELKNGQETGDITLKDVTLSSANALSGAVAAKLETADVAAKLSLSEEEGATSKSVKYTFGDGAPVTIAPGKSLKFTVFALGAENLVGLSADFSYGNGTVRHVVFKKSGNDITFNPCKKYRLLGIMLKEEWYFAEINLEGEPLWLDKPTSTDNKNYPEATQFDVEGANNGRYYTTATQTEPVADRDKKAYRQYWLMKNEGTVIVRFKIMSPEGYKWLVVPEGDTNYYTIQTPVTQDGATTLSETLEGTIKEDGTTTNVIIYITPKNPGTAAHTLNLRTYAVSQDGKIKYSLDSETQLFEMRGYHYFVLNTTLD